MKFDFSSQDPERDIRDSLLEHLKGKYYAMPPMGYLKYCRHKLSQFNEIIQRIYEYQIDFVSAYERMQPAEVDNDHAN